MGWRENGDKQRVDKDLLLADLSFRPKRGLDLVIVLPWRGGRYASVRGLAETGGRGAIGGGGRKLGKSEAGEVPTTRSLQRHHLLSWGLATRSWS